MDLLDDDGGVLGQMNREQLQAMLRRMMVSFCLVMLYI